MFTKALEREKRQLLKENLVKRAFPKLHEISPFLPPRNSSSAGKCHGRVKRHGRTVSFWLRGTVVPPGTRRPCQISVLLPGFASRGTTCSCCLAPLASRGTPFWVGFSSNITFGLLFWAYLHITYKTLNKTN